MKKFLSWVAVVGPFVCAASTLAVVGGGDITMKGGKAGKVIFSHDFHVGQAGLVCKDCHTRIYLGSKQHKPVNMGEMQKGKSCGACHNGNQAFSVKGDCAKCHKK